MFLVDDCIILNIKNMVMFLFLNSLFFLNVNINNKKKIKINVKSLFGFEFSW